MKLAAPLRVTWDWNWSPAVQPGAPADGPEEKMAMAIGGELARARVLLLEVGYPGLSSIRSGLLRSVLKGVAAQVSLVLTPETVAALPVGDFSPESFGAVEVWVDVTPRGDESGKGRALPRSADGSAWPDIRLYLTSSNWRESAALLAEAVEGGARRLSLPILPLFGSFCSSLISLYSFNSIIFIKFLFSESRTCSDVRDSLSSFIIRPPRNPLPLQRLSAPPGGGRVGHLRGGVEERRAPAPAGVDRACPLRL